MDLEVYWNTALFNYRLKLTGWNSWWIRVTRDGWEKMKQNKLESVRTKAENVRKYLSDTIKTVTNKRKDRDSQTSYR